MSTQPTVVVGTGLAGLACAWHLQRRRHPVRVLESAPEIGGLLRTDRVDGFQLDRGFQVLQTAYPEARAVLDYEALRLRPFDSGAVTRTDGAFREVSDPLRHPSRAWSTLRSGVLTPGDAWRVLALRRRVCGVSLDALFRRPATSTSSKIGSLGFSKKFVDAFLAPFYRGVLLEPALASSSRVFEFTFRMFASGPVALPEDGIEAIPKQLAQRLDPNTIRLEAPVSEITEAGVRLVDGEEIEASRIVLATDAATACQWIPELEAPDWNAVSCVYFSASRAPLPGPQLILNGEGEGPINHVCFPTEVSPTYAPAGKTLVSATVLGDPAANDAALTSGVRDQLRDWWGSEVDDWEPLRVDRVRLATPLQHPAWLDPVTRPVRFGSRLFVCGAHRETSSIGGALRSGRRAAQAVLQSRLRD